MKKITESIRGKSARVAVIGLGYVGLPLSVELGKVGFEVIVIDINKEKVDCINRGESYVFDIDSRELYALVKKGKIAATADYSVLQGVDIICICVPTPLNKSKDPDISHIINCCQGIAKYLKRGHLIVVESTTYPGTTREIVKPILENSGMVAGKDFYLAFSPERIDPGNKRYFLKNTPKVVGGLTPACTELAKVFFEQTTEKVIPVSSTESAEMVKLLENTFRSVNIALVNEVAIMCYRLGIDVWEIIEAASTKPFGFITFYPGPGSGGHCIPVDPHYLSWKLKMLNYYARFIELAGEINSNMPYFVVNRIIELLNDREKPIKGSTFLVLGIAYKRDIDDTRESPSIDIMRILMQKGGRVFYNDPYVPSLKTNGETMKSQALTEGVLAQADCVIIATDHSVYDYKWIVEHSQLVFDTRNATRGITSEKVYKL